MGKEGKVRILSLFFSKEKEKRRKEREDILPNWRDNGKGVRGKGRKKEKKNLNSQYPVGH